MQRRFRGGSVILNVYDLSPANDCLCTLGLGAHHSGVEINGREYTFSDSGVFDSAPRDESQAPLRTSVNLGEVSISHTEVDAAISRLRPDFAPGTYNVLTKNCNVFSRALVLELLGLEIPGYVNRLAWLGSWFSCCVPTSLQTSDPPGTVARPTTPSFRAFAGKGQTLADSGTSTTASTADGIRARRERAIAAAESRARAAAAAVAAGNESATGLKEE